MRLSCTKSFLTIGALVFASIALGTSFAGTRSYVENFTSTQYKDTLNTTALWDTVAGEFTLHDFEYNEPARATFELPSL
jgi:hypothetical protein